MPDSDNITPPSRRLLMRESRGLLDIPALLMAAPFLAQAPRGDKHTVMVLPGFSADDRSTAAIRQFLRYLKYDVHGWAQGRNLKGAHHYDEALSQRLEKLFERRNRSVFEIGLKFFKPHRINRQITFYKFGGGCNKYNLLQHFRSR